MSVGPLVSSVSPIAVSKPFNTVSITATASPGTSFGSVNVPPTPVIAIFVGFTDVSLVNTSTAAVNVAIQIQATGFGLSTTFTQTLGAVTSGGFNANVPASSATFLDTVWWYTPNGGNNMQLNIGGTISILAFASTASVVNASNTFVVVYGSFGGTV